MCTFTSIPGPRFGRSECLHFHRSVPFLLFIASLLAFSPDVAYGQIIDLTTPGSEGTVNGAIFRQNLFDGSTGTGVFESFVRIQANPLQEGHNTDFRPLMNDELSSPFTRDLDLDAVPIVTELTVDYREFRLDINQTASESLLSLDEVVVFVSPTPLQSYGSLAALDAAVTGAGGSEVFDLDSGLDRTVLLDYLLAPGSGNGDMLLFIPDNDFTCAGSCFVYLWSSFGAHDEDNQGNDGFEEWSVRKQAGVGIGKTALPSFTRTFAWDIIKSVNPDMFVMFAGESDTAGYTVEVDQTVTDGNYSVSGNLTIANLSDDPSPQTRIQVLSVVDILPGAMNLMVECNASFPIVVNAGEQLVCTYSADLPDSATRTNEVQVTYGFGPGNIPPGDQITESAFAEVNFNTVDPTIEGFETVDVTDDNGEDWPGVTSDSTFVYDRNFECSSDPGFYTDGTYSFSHLNTATITQTGQSDDANVDVTCYAPVVSKDAFATYDRDWTWTIDKSADQDSLMLMPGQLFPVNYTVTVDATFEDVNIAVNGTITVVNPHPDSAMVVSLTDVLSDGTPVTLCADAGSFTVPADDSNTCAYSAAPDDIDDLTNVATATFNSIDFSTGNVAADFGDPSNETDECIDVTDTNVGVLGTVCAADAPATFEYTLFFGQHPDADVQLECGDNTHRNVASFVTNDTGTMDDDDWTVNAQVACETGCTLTQGYWKTHSERGPAPYDSTWNQLPGLDGMPNDGDDGSTTLFYFSGQDYFDVLWTSPQGGNAYYILAHQYIAAQLNGLNGVSMPSDVQTAFDEATAWFDDPAHTPATAGLKGRRGNLIRRMLLEWAGILAGFNEGATGPGHCSEALPNQTAPQEGEESSAKTENEEEAAVRTAAEAAAATAEEASALASSADELPREYGLGVAYPNPFRNSTTMRLALPEEARVTARVYDLLGRQVAVMVDRTLSAGAHDLRWDVRNVASGAYVIVLQAGDFVVRQQVTVVK